MTLEQTTQRKLTRAFINTQPVEVILTPRERTKTPAGGTKFEAQAPRAPQIMRLVEPGAYGGPLPRPVATLDGVQREVEFELLGEWDAVMANYDTFTLPGGNTWEIVQVAHFNGWEQRALVARVG